MIIQKILETRLDLTDPSDIINADLMRMCTAHITQKFVGRCFKSCLIIKINRIVRHSRRYMSEDLSGSAYITVTFEVDCITFAKGEVINGCHILKIEADGRIHAKSKYAGVQVRQNAAAIYREGQIVPFIVRRVSYNPAQTAISIEALPFTPVVYPLKIYAITSGLVNDDAPKLKYLFGKLSDLIESIDKRIQANPNEKNAFDFFRELLYPFKKPAENKLGGFEKRRLDSIMSISSGFVYQPSELKLTNQEFYYSEHLNAAEIPEKNPDAVVHEKDIAFVAEKILNRTIQHYTTLSEFVDTYPTFDKVQEYKDVWRMFNMLKR